MILKRIVLKSYVSFFSTPICIMASFTEDLPYDPSVVICKEIIDSKWNGGMNAPNFDFTPALSHAGLMNKLGRTDIQARDKIETKMNDLDQKMKSFEFKCNHLRTWIVILSFALFTMTFVNICIGSAQIFMDDNIDWSDMKTKHGMIAVPSKWMEMILIPILLISWCTKKLIASKRNEKFSSIVEDHFIDWKEKGINVELQYKEEDGGCIDFDDSKLRSLKIFLKASNDKY